MEDHTPEAGAKARKLRQQMSLPEVLLWRELKARPQGLKFRRQHPIGNYVADFYCASALTIVEVDGIAHDMGTRPIRDQRRDAWLRGQGLTVLRIPAAEVLKACKAVASAIVQRCVDAPPPTGAGAPATSPRGGGITG